MFKQFHNVALLRGQCCPRKLSVSGFAKKYSDNQSITRMSIEQRLGTKHVYSARDKLPSAPIQKSLAEWAKLLSPDQMSVCRMQGTETAYSHEFDAKFEKGVYSCVCCGHKLFSSHHKYDSHCGWPSYYEPLNSDAVFYVGKNFWHMVRVYYPDFWWLSLPTNVSSIGSGLFTMLFPLRTRVR